MRYWVIKGNPRENDLDLMLERGVVATWRTGKPPKKWERRDRVFFWSSAPRLELVGLGELVGPTGDFTRTGETIYAVKYLTAPLPQRIRAADLRADTICQNANFLKPAVAQGVLEVADDQAHRMYAMLNQVNGGSLCVWTDIPLAATRAHAASEPARSLRPSSGQGFGDADRNAIVERAAIAAVSEDYRRRGWAVRSVERDKCGYDLECRLKASQECIEVKGISGSVCSFFLTAAELAAARREAQFVLYAVTTVLEKPRLHRITLRDLEQRFRLDPIAFRAVPIARR